MLRELRLHPTVIPTIDYLPILHTALSPKLLLIWKENIAVDHLGLGDPYHTFTSLTLRWSIYCILYSRLKTLCYTNKQNLTELSLTIHLPQWFLLRSHALCMCDPNKLSQTLGSHRVCWGHTCAKHVTSTQIIEEADWMVSKISETFCLFLWVFIKLYCLFFCSRRVFGVVEERCVCIVLDLDATTDSQFDIYRHALIQALKEQIMFLAKFNLIRFVASLAI